MKNRLLFAVAALMAVVAMAAPVSSAAREFAIEVLRDLKDKGRDKVIEGLIEKYKKYEADKNNERLRVAVKMLDVKSLDRYVVRSRMEDWLGAADNFLGLEAGSDPATVDLSRQSIVAVQLKSSLRPGWSMAITPVGDYEFIVVDALDGDVNARWVFEDGQSLDLQTTVARTLNQTHGKETSVSLWISPETTGRRFRVLFKAPPDLGIPPGFGSRKLTIGPPVPLPPR